MTLKVQAADFHGPLDLLLQLVEREKLDLSEISLAAVADQFVQHVHAHPEIPPAELADYLLIAAKLVYLKSKLLIPSFIDEELEEGPDLETQLREYRRFVEASKRINALWNDAGVMYARREPLRLPKDTTAMPANVTAENLLATMHRVIARLTPVQELPKARMRRVVTLQEKIRDLLGRIRTKAKMTFHEFCEGLTDRREAVVSFLAILELAKQRYIHVEQGDVFSDIQLKEHPDAPADQPITESFL